MIAQRLRGEEIALCSKNGMEARARENTFRGTSECAHPPDKLFTNTLLLLESRERLDVGLVGRREMMMSERASERGR